jgi:hypothetical protein
VIPIPYQNHGESDTEWSLLKSVLESPHFSFEPNDFSLLKGILESPHFSFEECVLALTIYVLVKTLSWWGVTRFAQPCVHTDALSVLLSALYLYLLPRVLIWRRTHTSGAGSSLFCALTVE